MAQITLSIPDAAMPRVIDALCARGGREDDSPIAKGPFAKSVVIDFVRTVTRHYEAELAGNTARVAALAKADTEVTIT